MNESGVWLPVVTPFRDGQVDYESFETLVNNYVDMGISGIIPLGTTGECPVINETEFINLIDKTIETVNYRIPVYAGVGGNDTASVITRIKTFESRNIDGILSVCPYYNRPGQDGLYSHFKAISESSPLSVIMYNIPYRTGVNMSNDTIRKLAEFKNITGIKDSSGDIAQTLDLLTDKPDNFSVLTGEDLLFFTNIVNGGDGGILASSHLYTTDFVKVYELVKANDHQSAFDIWRGLADVIPLLFQEANPGPVKFCLKQMGLMPSCEMRLPMTEISETLKKKLKSVISV